jgi:predicted small integral membrane protein
MKILLSKYKACEWLAKGFSMTRRKTFAALVAAYLIWGVVFSVIIGVWFRPILSRFAAGLCFRQSVSYDP